MIGRPLVSVVVPTRNGAGTLPELLDRLAAQQTGFPFEVIAVDSSSTDGTSDLLRARVDQLITIPAGSFNHGATRNLGISRAAGDFVVLLVQDAWPASSSWLATLASPLFTDARLAGTFARQVPRPEASALTRHYLAQWAATRDAPRLLALDRGEFVRLSPLDRLDRCTFDNVCSCIRRSVWQSHPFPSMPIAEDLGWAKDVLLAGHMLAYVPEAVVVHSHDRPARYEFLRTYQLHRQLNELFEVHTIPTAPALARAVFSSLSLHVRCRQQDPRGSSWSRAAALAVAWPLGQYLGARAAVRRRPSRMEAA